MTDYEAFAALIIFGLPALMLGVTVVAVAGMALWLRVMDEMY